jgi:hypothetical protein
VDLLSSKILRVEPQRQRPLPPFFFPGAAGPLMYRIKPLQSGPFEAYRNGRSAARCGVLLRIDTGAGGASGRARL